MELNTLNVYVVNTTNGDTLAAGFALLSANLRDTDKRTVPPEQRYRNVAIRELSIPSVEDKFRPVLLDKLYSLAQARFAEFMESTNRMGKTVNAEDYTIGGLLSYYATDAKSGRMTKESVLEWFNASATCKYITSKNAAVVDSYRTNFAKLASPSHGLNPNTCRSLLAVIQDEDTSNNVCAALASRMQQTITKSEQSQVAAL